MAAAESDLQLVAVRFVDPGHPEEKLGPRYRVWFRNNGSQPITQPFNVDAVCRQRRPAGADLPQAGVRVTAIEAGDIQSVDIRLPVEVYAMGRDAQGKPAPFSVLHVLVDANREVPKWRRTNNGARLVAGRDSAGRSGGVRVGARRRQAGAGGSLWPAKVLGREPGQVLVHVGGQEMEGEILGWYDLGVRWTLPKLAIAAPTEAEVIVIRGDGAAANPLKITVGP